GESHLLEVLAAVPAEAEVAVDGVGDAPRQRAIEVGGDELHPLLAHDLLAPPEDLHGWPPISSSRAARTRLRARCNNTRWFTSLNSRRSRTSSDDHPSMSRSTRTRR